MYNRNDLEKVLNDFCPELHPIVGYSKLGLQVRCRWALEFTADPCYPVEHSKAEMLDALYHQIGVLTVLIHKLEQK